MLVKHLLGEASPEETVQVNKWLAEDALNAAYYSQLKAVWEQSRLLAITSTVDEDKAWKKFQQRIHAEDTGKTTKQNRKNWLKLAASVVLLMGLGWLGFRLFNKETQPKEILVQSQQQILKDTLPDGSVVTLNKTSSISYPEQFKNKTRTVVLTGEGFFNVTPNSEKPFIIQVNDVQVRVVGTSFNIKTHEGKTEVLVETGVVQVTKNGKSITLHSNDKMVVNKQDSTFGKIEPVKNKLYKYYRTKEFVCDNTPLWQLVDVLNEAYDAHIEIGRKELGNLLLTATFVNESLSQVLNVINLTFDIKITRTEGKIILE